MVTASNAPVVVPLRGLYLSAPRLKGLVQCVDADVVYLVGHNPGGLVIRRWLHDFPCQRPGRALLGRSRR